MNILRVLTEKRRIGNFGERAAARYLFWHGYRILKRNYTANGHEIDLIAKKKNVIAYVEVKTRTIGKMSPDEPRPAAAVTPEKQRGIMSAARFFHPTAGSGCRMRFDIVEVYLKNQENGVSKRENLKKLNIKRSRTKIERIVHLQSAFDRDTAYRSRNR